AAAAASPEVAVKDSAAAAVVESALDRAKAAVPPASAAEFRAAQAPAAAVGQQKMGLLRGPGRMNRYVFYLCKEIRSTWPLH
ncbi:MAG: hypothetical protein ACKO9F_05220, partial [Caldilinea sp.]